MEQKQKFGGVLEHPPVFIIATIFVVAYCAVIIYYRQGPVHMIVATPAPAVVATQQTVVAPVAATADTDIEIEIGGETAAAGEVDKASAPAAVADGYKPPNSKKSPSARK